MQSSERRVGNSGCCIGIIIYILLHHRQLGYKMARDGRWEVWEGMWLSSAVLLPLGIFLTYKAVNDADVFNKDPLYKLHL